MFKMDQISSNILGYFFIQKKVQQKLNLKIIYFLTWLSLPNKFR